MATTQAQREQIVEKLCSETDRKVREVHKGASTFGFSLNAIEGWFNNQWNRPTTSADMKGLVGRGAGRVVALFVSSIPLLGSLISMGTDEMVARTRRKADEAAMKDGRDPEVTGNFLVEHGMQAYVDALRKAHQAEIDFNKQAVGSCRDLTERVARFYYWKYRLERLSYYHAIVQEYSKRAATVIAQAESNLKLAERDMKAKAPKVYEDWTWHREQCKGFCTFPWETLEISGPTNVTKHNTMFPAGPGAGQAVPVVPTGSKGKNALPLPPRPPGFGKK